MIEMQPRIPGVIGQSQLEADRYYIVLEGSGYNCTGDDSSDQVPLEYGGERIDLTKCMIEYLGLHDISVNATPIRGAMILRLVYVHGRNLDDEGYRIRKVYAYLPLDTNAEFRFWGRR